MTHKRTALLTGFAVLAVATTASAFIYTPAAVPEALSRAKACIKDHPKQAEGYFFLGCIEGSAWAKGITGKDAEVEVGKFGDADGPPRFVPWHSVMFPRNAKLEMTPEALKHLSGSIAAYRKAVELDPNNPHYHLALAWSLEEAARAELKPADVVGDAQHELTEAERQQCQAAVALLGHTDIAQREQASKALSALMPRNGEFLRAVKSDDPEVVDRIASILRRFWLDQAVEQYRKAYQQSVERDLKAGEYNDEGDKTISVKAGERLLVLLPAQGGSKLGEIETVAKSLQTIKAKPVTMHVY